jgi:hypothetical protein
MTMTIMTRIIRRNATTYLSLLTLLWGVSWFLYCQQAMVADGEVDHRTTFYLPSPEERQRISVRKYIPPFSSVSSTRRQKADNLWENNPALPVWMKEYFEWHHEQVSQLNETNWKSQRYLVLRCLQQDRKCGGAADRLRVVPVALLVAHQFNRILLIHWERPCPLREFLVPPITGGLDWRIPAWLQERLKFRKRPLILTLNPHATELLAQSPDLVLADMLLQINDHGASYYFQHTSYHAILNITNDNEHSDTRQKSSTPASTSTNSFALEDIYLHVWDILFQPSPAVAALIQKQMQELQLTDNNYAAVHIRSQYLRDKSSIAKHAPHFRNAVHCASQLLPGASIFIAADAAAVTEYAVNYGREKAAASAAKVKGATAIAVVARPTISNSTNPLHLDRGSDYLATGAQIIEQEAVRRPSDYYDIFVDLYLLARSKCIALHTGGYGHWARLMSHTGAGQCWINHGTHRCQWTSGSASSNGNSIG